MALTRTHILAPPEAVFAVLANPFAYDTWVVGTKRIRGADPGWPAPGARLHHTLGVGPLRDRSTTTVREIAPPRCLVLEAAAWPAGSALVTLRLEPVDGGTDLTLDEQPLRGVGRLVPDGLAAPLTIARNTLALRRLKAAVEAQHRGREPDLRRSP